MKTIFLLPFLLMFSGGLCVPKQAICNLDIGGRPQALEAQKDSLSEPYICVEQMPTFQGGDLNKFRTWVQSRLKYPKALEDAWIYGRVTISFVIEKDGSLADIQVLQTPDTLLSEEAVRVLKTSPKWTPGKQRNIPVRVKFIMPVDFRLIPAPEPEKDSLMLSDTPILVVEEMPTFQGEDLSGFRKWVQEQLEYPKTDADIAGRVIVTFVIEPDGSLTNVTVLRSPDNVFSAEAVRVVESSPKWVPGKKRGVPVRMKFTLPVDFRIQN